MSVADIINRELRTNPYVKKQIDPEEFDDVGCEDDLPWSESEEEDEHY